MLFGFNISSSVYNPLINYKWGTTLSSGYVTDGVELVVNGGFDSDDMSNYYANSVTASIVEENGAGRFISTEAWRYVEDSSQTTYPFVAGETYLYKFDILETNADIRVGSGSSLLVVSEAGSYEFEYTYELGLSRGLRINAYTTPVNALIDNISVQKVIQEPNKVYLADSGTSPKYPASLNYGRGIEFNGVDQSVGLGHIPKSESGTMFFTVHKTSSTVGYVIDRWGGNRLYIYDDGGSRFKLGFGSTGGIITTISPTVGHTYAISYIDNTWQMYDNGVLSESGTYAGLVQDEATLTFIGSANGTVSFSDGSYNNIIFINEVCSQAEITYQYNNPEKFLYREDNILKSEILTQAEIDNVVAYLPMCETDDYVRDYANYSEVDVPYSTTWVNTNTAVSNEVISISGASNGLSFGTLESVVTIGEIYLVELEITSYTSGSLVPFSLGSQYPVSSVGIHSFIGITTGDTVLFSVGTGPATMTIENVSVKQLSGIYPISNYTTSCNATNLEYGLQSCFWKRDLLGVPYASSFDALECDGVGYADTGWVPSSTDSIEVVYKLSHTNSYQQNGLSETNVTLYYGLTNTNTLSVYSEGVAYFVGTIDGDVKHIYIDRSSGVSLLYINGVIKKTGIVATVDATLNYTIGAKNNSGVKQWFDEGSTKLFKVHTEPQDPLELYNNAVSKGLLT